MFLTIPPHADTSIPVLFLLGLGAVVGVLGGFFGVGGGWIVTPVLNIFGMPMPFAVGTGLAYITGMSSVSAWRHRRHGNTQVKLGLAIGLSMIAGVKLGETAMNSLAAHGQADSVVRGLYVILLLSLGTYMLQHTLRARRAGTCCDPEQEEGHDGDAEAPLQKLNWKPEIGLGTAGQPVSLLPVLLIGLMAGLLTGILGVGGGFILMPIMIYLIGLPTVAAVATSLMCLLLASPFGAVIYALAGRVDFLAAAFMVVGALAGAPIGVHASHKVHGGNLRLLYAIMIMVGGCSVILKQLDVMYPERFFALASKIVILGAAGGMAGLIIILMLLASHRERIAGQRSAAGN